MPAAAAVNAEAVGAGVVEDGVVCCVAEVRMAEEEVEEGAAGVTTAASIVLN